MPQVLSNINANFWAGSLYHKKIQKEVSSRLMLRFYCNSRYNQSSHNQYIEDTLS